MPDSMGKNDPLQAVPGFWNTLLNSGFFFVDHAQGVTSPSRFMVDLGYRSEDFQAEGIFHEAIHPADRRTYDALWDRVSDGLESEFFVEYRVRTRKGGYRWDQTFGIVLGRFPDGRVSQFFGLDRDISPRKQSESLLHNRFVDLERRYLVSESLRIASSVVTASLDLDSTIPTILNQAETLFPFTGARIWAYREDHLEWLGAEEAPSDPEQAGPETHVQVLRVAQDKIPVIIDNLASRPSCQGFHASWIGIPLLLQGECRGVIEFWNRETGFFRSEHVWPAMAFGDNVAVGLFNARQYKATQEAGETDTLTGLGTRRRLERLGPELFRQARVQGEDLTVFMVDLDFFKAINDNYGHAQGDAVLRHFAQTCLSVLRKGDLVCRFGGDEFVVLLPRTSQGEATLVGLRICELFKEREFPFQEHKVSLSLGIAALKDGDFEDLDGLLKAADTALYRVKQRGRDGILAYKG